ncbi:MAG: 2TM domain-containing protein [Eudoraea sp.]|nr:2TM domain-containing protein [Eudoraea sp.]
METISSNSYERARRKVACIKSFYRHLIIYIVVNIGLLVVSIRNLDVVLFQDTMGNDFETWVFWNVLCVPIFWGIGLLIHALRVFKPTSGFVKEWEERQLERLIAKEEEKEKYL